MKSATLTLPNGQALDYQIRLSARAKYMRMTFSPDKGLIVTQPPGVCRHTLNDWINTKLDWISQTLDKMEARSKELNTSKPIERPEKIELTAVNETLKVEYFPTSSPQIATDFDGKTIKLSGATNNTGFSIHVLQKWLQNYGKFHLGVLLEQASQETGLTYKSYRIKAQKSRWGSCSSLGNINLNYKLMMMPPDWARYTIIHELCHTVEMNHSRRFWTLVESFVPDYKRIHQEMKQADTHLPVWVNYQMK